MACLVLMPALATGKHGISRSCTAETCTKVKSLTAATYISGQCFAPNTGLRHLSMRSSDARVGPSVESRYSRGGTSVQF